MTIEVALLISVISVAFSIFFGLKNNKRSDVEDIKSRVERDTKTDAKRRLKQHKKITATTNKKLEVI